MSTAIKYLQKIGERIEIGAGQYITNAKEEEYFYMLVSGRAEAERLVWNGKKAVFLFWLESTARCKSIAVNPAAFFEPPKEAVSYTLSINYWAKTDCILYRVRIDFLRTKLDQKHKDAFYLWIGRQMNWQNIAMIRRLTEKQLTNHDKLLARLYEMAGDDRPQMIKVNLTELAHEFGITRETASNRFRAMERQGLVRRFKGRFVVVF